MAQSFAGGYTPLNRVVDGRLTLTTAVPVTTADVTAATTIYFTPYKGNSIALYTGTNWKLYQFTEISVAVPATTITPFDIFIYDNAGTLALETTNWTNDTTRATALVLQNGVYVRSGATTRRYLGTGRTTGVSGQTEDSDTNRYLWNNYNRVERRLRKVEATASWTYATETWRSANASNANRVNIVLGLAEDPIYLWSHNTFINNTANGRANCGIGENATAANSAQITTYSTPPTVGVSVNNSLSILYKVPAIGGNFYQWTEIVQATTTATFYGTSTTIILSGLNGHIKG